ncbi:mannitol dehydrogenase family protein [Microbacterium arabinogalactanolyticum]
MRIVHLGLGAFHRSHQAWYTARADEDGEWGIAAFTGRGPEAARLLGEQDGLYTLVERGGDGDRLEVIESIVQTHDAAEITALRELVSRPEVTIVTLTVTEKGYRLGADRRLDAQDADVLADAVTTRAALADGRDLPDGALRTMPGRLLWALLGRAEASAGPIAVIPCDNLADNAGAVRASVLGMAELVGRLPGIDVDWIGTSVDRITPRTTDADVRLVTERTGVTDLVPVVTESYSSWILSGVFRVERPRWEDAGATFVDRIEPYERRKLWMLNGAHSLLAYAGTRRGHITVADAMSDLECVRAVEALWDLDARHLAGSGLAPDEYRADLARRFTNRSIAHHLRQIAADGSVKLRDRVVGAVMLDRQHGGSGDAGLRAVAEWISFVETERAAGRTIDDVAADEIGRRLSLPDPIRGLVELISPDLAGSGPAMLEIERLRTSFSV